MAKDPDEAELVVYENADLNDHPTWEEWGWIEGEKPDGLREKTKKWRRRRIFNDRILLPLSTKQVPSPCWSIGLIKATKSPWKNQSINRKTEDPLNKEISSHLHFAPSDPSSDDQCLDYNLESLYKDPFLDIDYESIVEFRLFESVCPNQSGRSAFFLLLTLPQIVLPVRFDASMPRVLLERDVLIYLRNFSLWLSIERSVHQRPMFCRWIDRRSVTRLIVLDCSKFAEKINAISFEKPPSIYISEDWMHVCFEMLHQTKITNDKCS